MIKVRKNTHSSAARTLATALFVATSATALLSSNTQAAPFITDWAFSTDATFSNATFETGGTGTTSSSAYELSWGNAAGDFQNPTGTSANNRSALTVGQVGGSRTGGGPATGNIKTNFDGTPDVGAGEVGFGISLTHWNNTIVGTFDTLLRALLTDTLTLTPVLPVAGIDPGMPTVNAPTIDFDFEFRETPNNPPGNPGCAGGTPEPCGDLVGFQNVPNVNLPFSYNGNNYFASVLLLNEDLSGAAPIDTLDPEQCAELSLSAGCQGFLTSEAATTTVNFGFSVSAVPVEVPNAPTTLLLAMGLLGLGTKLRRQS